MLAIFRYGKEFSPSEEKFSSRNNPRELHKFLYDVLHINKAHIHNANKLTSVDTQQVFQVATQQQIQEAEVTMATQYGKKDSRGLTNCMLDATHTLILLFV